MKLVEFNETYGKEKPEMTLQELREYIEEAKQTASDDMQILIAKRASEALETGINTINALGSLRKQPNINEDFWGWDSWWSSYNRLVNRRTRCDAILSVCLEVMGLDYNAVQNVIKQTQHNDNKADDY